MGRSTPEPEEEAGSAILLSGRVLAWSAGVSYLKGQAFFYLVLAELGERWTSFQPLNVITVDPICSEYSYNSR